jgi:predicted Zn-dependent protease
MTARIGCAICLLAGSALAQPANEPGKGVNFYSLEKEIALGKALAADFRSRTRPLDNATALQYIDRIAQRLVAEIAGLPFTYTVALIADDPTLVHEAAAFPGGFLFVPASLILAAKDEDELAGMLAHSIAHVASRHGTKQATRAELVSVASVPLIFMGGWTGYAMQQNQRMAIPMGMLQMLRKSELDADRLAAQKMSAAGYDPAGLARYIERIQPPEDSQPKTWSALPQRSDRVNAIREAIAELTPQAYTPHQGLEAVQDELRRALATIPTPKAPPSLFK